MCSAASCVINDDDDDDDDDRRWLRAKCSCAGYGHLLFDDVVVTLF